jgi:MFS family permease
MSFTSAPRDLALAAAGRGVSVIGDEVALLALLLWAAGVGHGPAVVAALVLAAALPQLLLAPVSGTVVDRVPARALIATTSTVQALACLGLAATVAQGASPAAVVALVVVLNLGMSLVSPAWTALLPEIVGRADVARGLAALQTATATAALVGPVVGGALVGSAGAAMALVVDAASFLLLAVAVLAIRSDHRPGPGAARERGAVWRGVRLLGADPVLRRVVGLLVAMILAMGAVNVAEVFLITRALGAEPLAYGLVGASFAVGLVVGSRLAARRTEQRGLLRRIVAATLTMAAAIVVVGLSPTVLVAGAATFAVGVGNGLLNVSGQTLLVRRTPPAVLGRTVAAFQGAVGAAMIAATALGGVLLGVLEVRTVVVGCGVFALVAIALVGVRLLRATAGVEDTDARAEADGGEDDADATAAAPAAPARVS